MKRIRGAVAVLLMCVASHVLADYTTIVDNGPSSNRVDIVFLGDGYTAADIAAGTYIDHTNSYLNYMFSNSINSDPFHRYRNYFNVHCVEVVSNEAGADVPPLNIFRDTALNATYYGNGTMERLLTVSTAKANAARNTGLAGAGFTAEMQYVTVNDTRYGGSGGAYAVYAGGNADAHEIALHEVAHSFSDLADEYVSYASPYLGGEPNEVNVTADPTGFKWWHWQGYNQPEIGLIGAYEGARYYSTDIYRPSQNSKMRTLDRPFDAVGREKIIHDIYNLVDPFDHWTDNSIPLLNPSDLFVQPIDEDLIFVEWLVDDVVIPEAEKNTFNPRDFGYGAGDYVIAARGFDPTAFDPVDGWVRIDSSALEQYVAWNVTLTVPEPATLLPALFGLTLLGCRHRRTCG